MRLIDADEQERIIEELEPYDRGQYEKGYEDAKKKYVKNGKWIMDRIVSLSLDSCRFVPMCSECRLHFDVKTRYCPNCGADMKGEQNDE